MNTDQFTNLIQKAIGYGGTWLAANGYQSKSTTQALVGAAVALLTWYWSHRSNAGTTVVPPGSSQSPGGGKGPILLTLGIASLVLCSGCTSAITSGHVVSVTERGFGIIVAQSTAQETPEVKLGFFSSAVVLEPTVTNANLTAPNFANTFALGQSINPFAFDVNETIASGNYQTGNSLGASNPIAAQPIVPAPGSWPPVPPPSTGTNAPASATTPAASFVPAVLNNPVQK
jgi:hypothetical protein